MNVSAVDNFKSLTVAGGVAGGFVGVAGGIDIGVANSSVNAYIGAGSMVKAKSNVDVNALSRKDVSSYAVSVGGGFVGVAGSVSVWTVGTQPVKTYFDGGAGIDRGAWSAATASAMIDNPDTVAVDMIADTATRYHQGDVVTYNGQKYASRFDQPQHAPDDTTLTAGQDYPDWAGETDSLAEAEGNDPETNKGTWKAGTDYTMDDAVLDIVGSDRRHYAATVASPDPNTRPSANPAEWTRVDWNTSTTYSEGDVVFDTDGNQYIARVDDPSHVSTENPKNNPNQWNGVSGGGSAQGSADEAASGEDSANGAPGFKSVLMGTQAPEAPLWVSGTEYGSGTIVRYNGTHYRAKMDIVGPAETLTPAANTTGWENYEQQHGSDSSLSGRASSHISGGSSQIAGSAPQGGVATDSLATAPVAAGTVAFIDGNVEAGNSVRVRANDKLKVLDLAGALAGGFVGIGVAVAILNVESNTEARIGTGAVIKAGSGGVVLVNADLDEDVIGISFAGAGGFVAVGAQVIVLNDTGTQWAHIDDGATILQAGGGVDVIANAERDVAVYAIAITTGGFSTGASIAFISITGDTKAEVGNVTIGTGAGSGVVGHFNVRATDRVTAPLLAISVSGGVGVGVAGAVSFMDLRGVTRAQSGAHGTVGLGGVDIRADGNHELSAFTLNVTTGVGATGVTIARADNKRNTEAIVTSTGSIATGGAVFVRALGTNISDVQTPGGSAGGVSIAMMLAWALVGGATKTTVNGSFTGTSSITIQSLGDNTAKAESLLAQVSLIGLGGSVAIANVTADAKIETFIGSTAYLTSSGRVVIEAKTRNQHNRALADAKGFSGGGVFAGSILVTQATIEGAVRVQMNGTVITSSTASTPGAPAIAITADGQNVADSQILVIQLTFGFSGSGSTADTEIKSNADVEITGSTFSLSAGGLIEISAKSDNHASTHSDLAAGGLLAVGVSVPTSKVDGGTDIDISGDITNSSGVTVQSTSNNFAEVDVQALQVGLIAVAVIIGDAQIGTTATTRAVVGSAASYSAPGGEIKVLATSTNRADSRSTSAAVGLGLSVA